MGQSDLQHLLNNHLTILTRVASVDHMLPVSLLVIPIFKDYICSEMTLLKNYEGILQLLDQATLRMINPQSRAMMVVSPYKMISVRVNPMAKVVKLFSIILGESINQ